MSAVSNRRSVSINSPIPTGATEADFDPTDAVFNANLVTSTTSSIKDWRPMSSVSQPERLKNDSDIELLEDNEKEDADDSDLDELSPRTNQSTKASTSLRGRPQSKQTGRQSKLDNYIWQRTTLRQPCKYKPGGGPAKGQHKSFITMTQRTRTTIDGIKTTERSLSNSNGDRVCRPYSTYSVSKSCERLAISPYGGPILPSAAGRYREHYQTRNPPKLSKANLDALNSKFQKFYINQDLIAITENKKPAGVLKRPPPPKTVKKGEGAKNSLHHGAKERMSAVQSTLGWQQPLIVADGKRFGVGYQVAMELSHNLDKHRKGRSASAVPEVPPPYQAPISDAARLNNQSLEYLTQGEISIRQSIKSNAYDPVKPKREPTKFIKKRPPSPPLSKLSRDKFLPEALRRREELERTRSFSGHLGLRLGKTPGIVDDTVSGGNIGHCPSTLSFQSEDALENEGAEHSSEQFSGDRNLVIRGQSAKHTPRGAAEVDPKHQITTTPRTSPEPLMSRRFIDQNDVPAEAEEQTNTQKNMETINHKPVEQTDLSNSQNVENTDKHEHMLVDNPKEKTQINVSKKAEKDSQIKPRNEDKKDSPHPEVSNDADEAPTQPPEDGGQDQTPNEPSQNNDDNEND